MGLLKKLGKVVKKVVKGVGKVFKKVAKFVGKVMASKWGKVLMIAATVFTMGAAAGLWGGFGAMGAAGGTAANAGGFFSKFVSGAKSILGIGGGAGAGGAAALAPGAGVLAAPAATTGIAGVAAGAGAASALAPAALTAGAAAAAPAAAGIGGLMAKAGGAAMKFLGTPGGATLAGNAIKGYAEGKAAEAQMEEDDRQKHYYDNAWRDPNQTNALQAAAANPIATPEGFMNRARRVDAYLDKRANGPAVDPNQVAQYAVGG